MLRGAFSFRGRIGRLHFFLQNLTMVLVALAACFGIFLLERTMPPGPARIVVLAIGGLGLLVAVIWFVLSLEVRRIRDIGWNPLAIILGVFFFDVVDAVVAAKAPWLAVSPHHGGGTMVGSICNMVFSLVLLFYPGRGDDAGTAPRRDAQDGPSGRLEAAAPRVVAGLPRDIQPGFGRRGLR